MKSGYKTTEFWGAVVTVVLGLIGAIPLPEWAYPVIYGAYAIARGLAKQGILRGDVGEALKKLPEKIDIKK